MRKSASAIVVSVLALFAVGCSRQGSTDGGARKARGAEGAVPVVATAVRREDVPIYLDGLGTVQAFNTVTVRAQVSGQLIRVPLKEGDEVRAGDVLAQVDPRTYQATLDQALAKKAQDEAQLANARADLQRYRDLAPDGYVTKQQVDQQVQTVAQFEAAVQADEAAIQSDRVQLSYTTIKAPISGQVGLRLVDVGNLVSSSDASGIVVVTQVKPISVVFTLPEQVLEQIRTADRKPLTVIAFNRDNQAPLAQGQLSVVDNQIDQSTGTIKLKATFANDDKALWPGQFVNVRLLVRTRKDGLVIPAQAVQRGPNGQFVYVVQPAQGSDAPTAAMRALKVAQMEDGLALVDDGLQAGEQVVIDGQYRLQPGAKVQIAAAGAAATAQGDAGAMGSSGASAVK